MVIVFADYERQVLEDYRQKKVNNLLSLGLMHPTSAMLKEESLRACRERFQKKDEKAIRSFCGEWTDSKSCLQILQQCDTDKFKPIVNFLKGKSENTGPKYIEILAWLIDYNNRPYVFGETCGANIIEESSLKEKKPAEEEPVEMPAISGNSSPFEDKEGKAPVSGNQRDIDISEGEKQSDENSGGTILSESVKSKWQTRSTAIAVILLSTIGIGGYWWLNNRGPIDDGGCMYWAGDHYQPVPCSQKVPNTLVVALDTQLVMKFKKIMKPDTITIRAIGSIWYSKINNKYEFFTSDGAHPVVIGRRLRPITDFIVNNRTKQEVASDQ